MVAQSAFKLVKAAHLIDGASEGPVKDGAVLIEGSRILRVGRAQDVAAPPGALVEEHDYPTGTLLPGLIDVHCHFNYFGDGTHTDDVMAMPDDIPAYAVHGHRPQAPGVGGDNGSGDRGQSTILAFHCARESAEAWPRAPACWCAAIR